MDINRVRAAYIKRELGRALTASDVSRAAAAAREFRLYSQWFANSLAEPDRASIAEQLSKLESKVSHPRALESGGQVH